MDNKKEILAPLKFRINMVFLHMVYRWIRLFDSLPSYRANLVEEILNSLLSDNYTRIKINLQSTLYNNRYSPNILLSIGR